MDEEKKQEVWKKVKEARAAEEIIAIAKENDVELSVGDAETIYARLNQSGELSDDELAKVVGGFLFFFF